MNPRIVSAGRYDSEALGFLVYIAAINGRDWSFLDHWRSLVEQSPPAGKLISSTHRLIPILAWNSVEFEITT
jgi:hypothetical protein